MANGPGRRGVPRRDRSRVRAAISVAAAPRSSRRPPGWAGRGDGDAALVTAPVKETADLLGQALGGLAAASLTGGARVRRRLPVAGSRGPARWRTWTGRSSAPSGAGLTGQLDRDHPGLAGAGWQGAEDVEESGMAGDHLAGLRGLRGRPGRGRRRRPGRPADRAPERADRPAARGRGLARAVRRRPPPTRSRRAGCRSGGHGLRHPGASPAPWDSANSALR